MSCSHKYIFLLALVMLLALSSCLSIPRDLNLESYTPSSTNKNSDSAVFAQTSTPYPVNPTPCPILAVYRLGKVTLADDESRLYVREGPGENYRAVGAMLNGVIAKVFSEDIKDWDLIKFNGELYYAASKFIIKNSSLKETANEVYYYAATQQEHVEICSLPPAIIASSEAKAGQKIDINGDGAPDGTAIDSDGDKVAESLEYRVVDNLIDLKHCIPSIEFNLVLYSDQNPAGKAICGLNTAFLQYDAMIWLRKAQALFLEDGLSIKLYDAYRPQSTHKLLYKAVGAPYIDSSDISPHCRGASVDITLVNLRTGSPLDMPCDIYEFSEASYRNYTGMSEIEAQNIDYMESIMQICGFIPSSDFWWQYDFALYKNYMVTDHDADSMLLVRES